MSIDISPDQCYCTVLTGDTKAGKVQPRFNRLKRTVANNATVETKLN